MHGPWNAMRDGWRAVLARRGSSAAVVLILGSALAVVATTAALVLLLFGSSVPARTSADVHAFGAGRGTLFLHGDALVEYRAQSDRLRDLAVYAWTDFNLSDTAGSRSERVSGLSVDGDLFGALQWPMQLGRGFAPGDFAPGAAPVVVIGERLWRTRFGSDPAIVGRTLRLDGNAVSVVGVLPAQRAFPFQQQIYRAVSLRADAALRGRQWLSLVPLPDAAVRDALAAEVAAWQVERETRLGQAAVEAPLQLKPMWDTAGDAGGQMVGLALGVVAGLLLLLGAANAGGLLLLQWLARGRELATRQALGASVSRTVAGLALQATILLALSLVVALVAANAAVGALNDYLWNNPNGMPLYLELRLSPGVLLGTAAAGLATLLLLVWPTARRLQRGAAAVDLRAGTRAIGGLSRVGRGLFALQCVLAVATVVMALQAAEGARRTMQTDLGLDTGTVLVGLFDSADRAAQHRFARRLHDALEARPDVAAVSLGSTLPVVSNRERTFVQGQARVAGDIALVDDAFADVFGLRLRHGRWFDAAEAAREATVAVIDPALALQLFGSEDPVGRTFALDGDTEGTRYTVIGLSEPVRLSLAGGADRPSMFAPVPVAPGSGQAFAVRMRDDSPAHLATVEAVARGIDPDIALDAFGTFAQTRWQQSQWSRFVLGLFAPLGALAVLLAASGLAALLGTLVAQRVREIGVRRALGASGRSVASSLLGRLAVWGGAGTALGVAAAVALSGPFAQTLYGDAGLGVVAAFGALLTMLAGMAVAAAWPLRRALRVQPTEALRED